jgi:predicted ATPase
MLRFQTDDTPEQKLEKLTEHLSQYRLSLDETVPLFGHLFSLPIPEDHYPPLNLTPQRQRQKTLEAIVAIMLEWSERQPVLFILEDLHWSDPTTLEFIELLMDQIPAAAIDVILTCRPEFQPSWCHRSYLTEMSVNRLSREQIEQMAQQVVGDGQLPAEIVQQLIDKSDGVPLYVEEMTKAVLESGVLKESNGQYELAGSPALLSIPSTLQDSLMARLDRLVSAKAVAQSAAVLGRHFTYELLSAVSPLDEATLQQELARLVEAEIVYQRGMPPQATYTFKHALIQDAAYESLLRSTRQRYHRRIAQVLEAQFPDFIETQPELLAQHYTAAGCTEQAVVYWQRAGQQASERSANLEAISHFTTGIELLKTLPGTPDHIRQALTLHIVLGAALLLTKGQAAPEVEHTYTQARMLCQQVGETPELVPILYGLWRFYVVQRQFQTAQELGETLLHLAQHADDPALAVIAHYALGATLLWRGALPAARQHLTEAIAHHTTDQHHLMVFRIGQDPGVACRICTAFILWLLGYPNQALARLQEALTLAHTLRHPFSLAYARCWAAIIYQWCQDAPAVHEQADAAVALATVQDFPLWAAQGMCLRGWALAMQGQDEEGMAQVCQGIAAWRAAGAVLHLPYLCTLLADVSAHLGHPEDGLQALVEAHTLMEQQEERYWEAEVCRLRGVLLLRQTETQQAEAETWLQRALTVAHRQEAKSLELRAAMSLAKLWQSQNKRKDAYDLLAPVYNWFTEGFDTADLKDAKALLDELIG